jgi:hypothetical protein
MARFVTLKAMCIFTGQLADLHREGFQSPNGSSIVLLPCIRIIVKYRVHN